MKLQNYLLALAVLSVTAGLTSCKKNNAESSSDEVATTVQMSSDLAVSDNLNSDAEYILNEAAVDKNFAGSRTTGTATTMNVLTSCATVTASDSFPKTISIDFGTGCTSSDGVFRTGKINITLSDSLRKSGSVAVMTFDNYTVSGFSKEGTITWTNTSTATTKSWERKCVDGKLTAPDGHTWSHSGTHDIVETAGSDTPNDLTDDVFSITGSSVITNSKGNTRTSTIVNALEKKTACSNIDKGTRSVVGPKHTAVIDYGDGSCDRLATVSIDGGTPKTIFLR